MGFCADLASLLADQVHISYLLRPVVDGKYGGETENGSWNGMVGELIRKVIVHKTQYSCYRPCTSAGKKVKQSVVYVRPSVCLFNDVTRNFGLGRG